jgi:imidazolonepropionase-like amidohydrolase
MSGVRAAVTACAAILLTSALSFVALAAQPPTVSDDPRRVPLPPPTESNRPALLIVNATLIDGTGARARPGTDVLIQGDRIVALGPTTTLGPAAQSAKRIDASGLFAVPGLIDLHLHFTGQRGDDFGRYRESESAAAIRATLLAGQLVRAGITAVREPGTAGDVSIRLREAVERGMLDGPRIFWSGRRIVSRGGHGDEITATASGRPVALETSPRSRVATGPWDWRLAVREEIRMQADWIKLTAPYTREEVDAAVDEAHMHGIPLTVDSFGKYTTWAVEAGIDCIEHPLEMPDGTIELMARRGTCLVPTLVAFYNVLQSGYPSAGIPAGGFYYTMSRRFVVDHDEHLRVVRAAHRAAVPIGVGTDIPFELDRRYPQDYYAELGFLKQAGLSDAEVLAAATRVGAQILKLGDRLGTIEPGKLADIVIVGADPLRDIQNLRQVRHIIADGRLVAPGPSP